MTMTPGSNAAYFRGDSEPRSDKLATRADGTVLKVQRNGERLTVSVRTPGIGQWVTYQLFYTSSPSQTQATEFGDGVNDDQKPDDWILPKDAGELSNHAIQWYFHVQPVPATPGAKMNVDIVVLQGTAKLGTFNYDYAIDDAGKPVTDYAKLELTPKVAS
jgi:hypothetical protein